MTTRTLDGNNRQVNIQLKERHNPAIARNISVPVAEIGILSNAV